MLKKLSSERRKTIDSLVHSMKSDFLPSRNFDPLFKKHGISYHVHLLFPTMSITTRRGEKFLFNFPNVFWVTREFGTAHELGHLVLEQNSDEEVQEAEADYFASRLTSHSPLTATLLSYIEHALLILKSQKFRYQILYENKAEYYVMMVCAARKHAPTSYKSLVETHPR